MERMADRRRGHWERRFSLLANPRYLLGAATVIGALAIGATAFVRRGEFPPGLLLLVVVIGLAVRAAFHPRFSRGWIYLFAAWAMAFVAYGALIPGF